MIRAAWLLAFVLVASTTGAQAARSITLREVFEDANTAASRGDYRNAIPGYETLIDAGLRDPDVFFNLASAAAQAGDYPTAILNYERALTIRPNDDQTTDNLRQAERALEEERAEREGEATIQRSRSISDAIYAAFTEDVLAYLLLLANACFFGCLGWSWVSRKRSGGLVALSVVAGLSLAFSAVGLGVKAGALRDGPRAVVVAERVQLREAPDDEARKRGETRGGDRGNVLDIDRDFVKLRLVSGAEGWAPEESVGLIDLDEGFH